MGSLREELKPGDLVVPIQYIDRTKSIRQHTFAGNGLVSHVSLADPVSLGLVDELKKQEFDFDAYFDRTSIIIEGPGFSTRAEANYYQKIGADIIGMTAFPEYALAREAGMHYLPCSFVTDYDCWRTDTVEVTVEQVTRVMRQNRIKAFEVAKKIIPATQTLFQNGCADIGISSGIMSHADLLNKEQQELLAVLGDSHASVVLG